MAKAKRNDLKYALWISLAMVLVAGARVVGGITDRDRCIAAARSLPVAATHRTVEEELHRRAPGGSWQLGAMQRDGSRELSWSVPGQSSWEWTCLDGGSIPAFVAVSSSAATLTPDRHPQ
jgi:hypothetical protein